MPKIKSLVYILPFTFFASDILAYEQDLNNQHLESLAVTGYPSVRALSFTETRRKYALTALFNSKNSNKNPRLYFADISPHKTGTSIGFRVHTQCTLSAGSGPLDERIISINSQKIEAFYKCLTINGKTETQEVFLIKSLEGNDFTKNEFAKNKVVYVHLNGLYIPFRTDGFLAAISDMDGEAL